MVRAAPIRIVTSQPGVVRALVALRRPEVDVGLVQGPEDEHWRTADVVLWTARAPLAAPPRDRLPLDDLAKAAGLDLKPFGSFLDLTRASDGRLYGLPVGYRGLVRLGLGRSAATPPQGRAADPPKGPAGHTPGGGDMYPERIVCLAAEVPEMLAAVGALDRVVGISAYTTRPAEALGLPKVSGFSHGSVERILSVRPDLAITTSLVQRGLASELMGRGVPVLHLCPQRFDQVLDSILVVAGAVGRGASGEALVDRLRAEAATVRAAAAGLPRRPRVYFEEWDDPLLHGIAWVSDLIEMAGGRDVFRERSLASPRADGRVLRPEEVLERDPEIVLASWCGKPFDRAALEARPGWSAMAAVRSGRVYALDSTVLQAGPMLLDSLRTIAGIVAAWAAAGS